MLISGRGSNLQALAQAIEEGRLHAQIVAVGCDRADAGGLQVAADHAIPVVLTPRRDYPDRAAFEAALFDRIAEYQPDWLVLAGFTRVLSADAVSRWALRMINLHPSLLPLYPGLNTHARALAAGDAEHGASVHLVTAQLDSGPVLAQVRLPVAASDDADALAARLQPLEHRLLVAVCGWLADGRLIIEADQIHFDREPLRAPVRLDLVESVR